MLQAWIADQRCRRHEDEGLNLKSRKVANKLHLKGMCRLEDRGCFDGLNVSSKKEFRYEIGVVFTNEAEDQALPVWSRSVCICVGGNICVFNGQQ